MIQDIFGSTCVLCDRPRVTVCIWPQDGVGGAVTDFCAECIESGEAEGNFGRCYICKDGLHGSCIGVPCQCPCPPPAERARRELARSALAKLTPEEIVALGIHL